MEGMLCLMLSLAATSGKALHIVGGGGPGAGAIAQLSPPTPAPMVNPPIQPAATLLAKTPIQPAIAPSADTPIQPANPPSTNAPIQMGTAPLNPNELRITGLGGGSAQWTIVILLTFLTLIPSVLICMTPFARLLIVFHFLRQALGLQTTPSNQTLIGLSVIMTFFLMQPIGVTIYQESVLPLQAGKITALDAVARAGIPMRQFMSHYVREKDVALFLEMAKEPRPANIDDVSFRVLLPAYILSELKAGFQIGAVLFLPFLVVDMVVASITTSVGMMQLPPVVISTPLKLLLFLMVDGWHLLIGALMRSFN
jgi:flagellar biosynthetic protein FliP